VFENCTHIGLEINFHLPTAKLLILDSSDAAEIGKNKIIIQGFKNIDESILSGDTYILYSTHLFDNRLNSGELNGETKLLQQFMRHMVKIFDSQINTVCTKDTFYDIKYAERQGAIIEFDDDEKDVSVSVSSKKLPFTSLDDLLI
jgi:S-adenosylmethionine:tRNA-ribosyltransferase-isomerase (queuine synthetase)